MTGAPSVGAWTIRLPAWLDRPATRARSRRRGIGFTAQERVDLLAFLRSL
ncbi:MAG TPA: hypothetical protein VFK02_23815 [Kofleriaceae bacterium]|nr:hypothetical protein [Kofleriaceae bacterium]